MPPLQLCRVQGARAAFAPGSSKRQLGFRSFVHFFLLSTISPHVHECPLRFVCVLCLERTFVQVQAWQLRSQPVSGDTVQPMNHIRIKVTAKAADPAHLRQGGWEAPHLQPPPQAWGAGSRLSSAPGILAMGSPSPHRPIVSDGPEQQITSPEGAPRTEVISSLLHLYLDA